jgi:hypothetical protein
MLCEVHLDVRMPFEFLGGRAAIGDKQKRYLVRRQPDKGKFPMSLDASAFSVVTQHKTPTAVPPLVLFPPEERDTFVSGKPFGRSRGRRSHRALCKHAVRSMR